MSRRGMAVGLVALVAVLVIGLRLWAGHLRDEAARGRAERLGRPANIMEARQAPVSEDGARSAPAMLPARTLAPVIAGKALRVADGSPLEGAVIEVLGAPGPDGRQPVLCQTNTVPDGRFAITASGMAATAVRLWFPVDYTPTEPPPAGGAGLVLGDCVVQTLPLPSDEQSRLELTFRVDTGWMLSGTVSDTTGQPLNGGLVDVAEPRLHGVIDAHGRYLIRDLPPAGQPLSVTATGMRVRGRSLDVPLPQAGTRAVTLDIQLAPAGTIYGKVTWRQGTSEQPNRPVVMVLNPPEGAQPGAAETLAAAVDSEDNFMLDGLGPGSWDLSCAWTVVVDHQQRTCATYARGVQVGAGEQVRHEFVLPGEATLQIKVTGADGLALAEHRVEVSHVLDPANPASPVLHEALLTTAADGTCTLDMLAPGTKELVVMGKPAPLKPGMAPPLVERLATQRVAVGDGPNAVTLVVAGH